MKSILNDIDSTSINKTFASSETIVEAKHDIYHESNTIDSTLIVFCAQNDLFIDRDSHHSQVEFLTAYNSINLHNVNINASLGLFFDTQELHIHGGAIVADDIFILKDCVQDIAPGVMVGNVHIIGTVEQFGALMESALDIIA